MKEVMCGQVFVDKARPIDIQEKANRVINPLVSDREIIEANFLEFRNK